jgi:hypothetical protein
MEIIILYNNPCPPPEGAPVVLDAQTPGASASSISACAKVDLFQHVAYYTTKCSHQNVIVKYKGHGGIHPRKGDSIQRVGLLGKLQGVRFARDKIDYSTNINILRMAFEIKP